MNAIIDADAFIFRAAVASEAEDLFVAADRVDHMINIALDEVSAKEYILFVTGKGNFRYNIYPEYKANRIDKPRPKWEQALKQHLIDQWQAEIVNGIEGDDACGIAQCGSLKDKTIIIHQDKDINMIPGWHYNFVKKEKYYVSNEEAIHFFFTQLLTGDTVDNLKGVVGIGKAKAEKLLNSAESASEMWEVVKDCYSSEEDMDMQAQCLWIHRKQNDNYKDWIDKNI